MSFTSATDTLTTGLRTDRVMQVLIVVCGSVWIWSAINPKFPADWLLENILVAVGVGLFVWVYRTRPLSDVSNILIAIFFCMHVAAAHYTYSDTPWGNWLKDILNTERNHYDRIVHFSFGLLMAYPVREFLVRYLKHGGFAAFFFAFVILVATSEVYEIIEWLTAAIVDPEAGAAFLGTQGDPFDAQKDTSLALMGTVTSLLLTSVMTRTKRP